MDDGNFDPGHQWRNTRYCFYCRNCTKFVQLSVTKIIIVATRCQILRQKCTKFNFGWGSDPEPARGAYSVPPDPVADGEVGCHLPKNPPPLSALLTSNLYMKFVHLILRKIIIIFCHLQMSDIKAKIHQIRFRLGLRPRPR